MALTVRRMRRIYTVLTLVNSLAVSFIWSINSLLLFDAGLDNTQALTANACFTLGYALFQIPTGAIADTWGRRVSYLLGGGTLTVTTVLYWLAWRLHAGLLPWAAVSLLLSLGFTFFAGATEAWLVDALHHLRFAGRLEHVFARAQVWTGIGTLAGSLGGAYLAEVTNVGVPFLVRAGLMLTLTALAWRLLHDVGFTPRRGGHPVQQMRLVLASALRDGWRRASVRWVMLGAFVAAGVGYYVAFAMKPYLLELAGAEHAYGLLGIAAALNAAAQMVGGLLATGCCALFRHRMSLVITGVVAGTVLLLGFGEATGAPAAMALLAAYSLVNAATLPARQAYLNGLVPTRRRATVLSFDSLVGAGGGVAVQPLLGRCADAWGYAASYQLGGVIQLLGVPLLMLARRHEPEPAAEPVEAAAGS